VRLASRHHVATAENRVKVTDWLVAWIFKYVYVID